MSNNTMKAKSIIFIILLAILLGAGFYFWHQQQNKDHAIVANAPNNQVQIAQLEIMQQQLAQQQQQITAQINQLNAARSPTILSDAIFLLQQAEYQLTIQQNRTAAIDLLNLAQQRVSIVNSIRFNQLMQAITHDLNTINSIKAPTKAELINQFTALNTQIEKASFLPTLTPTEPTEVTPEKPKTWREQLITNIKSLRDIVVVQHTDSLYTPILDSTELALFKQYLQSILQQALWAGLQNDAPAYQASLHSALIAINERLANQADNVANLKQEIAALQQINITPYSQVRLSSLAFAMNMNPNNPDKM